MKNQNYKEGTVEINHDEMLDIIREHLESKLYLNVTNLTWEYRAGELNIIAKIIAEI